MLAPGVTAEEGSTQGGSAGGGSLFAASCGRRKPQDLKEPPEEGAIARGTHLATL